MHCVSVLLLQLLQTVTSDYFCVCCLALEHITKKNVDFNFTANNTLVFRTEKKAVFIRLQYLFL